MAVNVNSLGAYVDENRLPLIQKAVLGAKTAKMFNLQTGVKKQAALNILDTNVSFGDGSVCGWTEAGSSALSQRLITVGNIKVNMSFCDKELLKTWAGYDVKVAAGYKKLPFEEDFIDGVVKDINEKLEVAIMQGDTDASNTNVNTNKFDGLLKIMGAEASIINIDATQDNTYLDKFMHIYLNIPVDILDRATILAGTDAVRLLSAELGSKSTASGNYENIQENGNVVILPNTNIKVIGVKGLVGTNKAIAGDLANNFFYGTDLDGDEEKFEFWYSQDNREFRLAVEFNAGVQIAFPSQAILAKLA